MKEITGFTPFFKFEKVNDLFVGYYQGNEEVKGNVVARFMNSEGDEYLLGGGQIGFLAATHKFEIGKKYSILYLGDVKITEGKNKGKAMHTYKIMMFEDDDELK